VLLVIASPLLVAAMIAIRLESKGSPVYKQRRVGKDGAPFELLKLRTMVTGAEHIGAGLAVNEGDPRITRVGALLRRSPRSRRRSTSTRIASGAGSRSSPASPAGRRSTAVRHYRGASGSSSTSGTSTTGRCGWT
jgi:hypothetical protein